MAPFWLRHNKPAEKVVYKILKLVNELPKVNKLPTDILANFVRDLYFANQMRSRIDISDTAVLRFQDLKNGDKFVLIPHPGDDDGHGGLRGDHYVFVKTGEDAAVRFFSKTHEAGINPDDEVFRLI